MSKLIKCDLCINEWLCIKMDGGIEIEVREFQAEAKIKNRLTTYEISNYAVN